MPDMSVFHRIVAMVAPFDWHIDLHSMRSPARLRRHAGEAAGAYTIEPYARVTAADGLDPAAFKILLELPKDPKCWVKASASSGCDVRPAVPRCYSVCAQLVEVAPDRIIWGTDWPIERQGDAERWRPRRSHSVVRAGTGI